MPLKWMIRSGSFGGINTSFGMDMTCLIWTKKNKYLKPGSE